MNSTVSLAPAAKVISLVSITRSSIFKVKVKASSSSPLFFTVAVMVMVSPTLVDSGLMVKLVTSSSACALIGVVIVKTRTNVKVAINSRSNFLTLASCGPLKLKRYLILYAKINYKSIGLCGEASW